MSVQSTHHSNPWQGAILSPQPALGPSHNGFQPNHGLTIQDAMRAPQPILDSSFGEPQQYGGLALRQAMPPPHHALDPRLSNSVNQTTFPATPTNPSQDTQVLSHQSSSPSTIHADDSPRQISPGINICSNFQSGPGQLDHTEFQPHYPPPIPYYSTVNGQHRQEISNTPTFFHSPSQNTQYGQLVALPQQSHYGRSDHHFSNSHQFNTMISPGVPSAALNALTSSHNCQCGPGCQCVFCARHPYNAATRENMQDLHQIVLRENQLDWTSNPTQSGHEDYPINDTNTGSVMEQEYPAPGEDPLAFLNAPNQDPALQPTIDGEGSAASGSHSSKDANTRMRKSQYYSMAYPVDNNHTEADEPRRYRDDCSCGGCPPCPGRQGE